jgi:hypothetical protein
MLLYFIVIWSILPPNGILCGHLIYFMLIWYIFPQFGMLYQGKSGNPGAGARKAISGHVWTSLWKRGPRGNNPISQTAIFDIKMP